MLTKDTHRRLKEHGWLEIEKKHSNPYVALNRFKHQATEAIDDLTLIAQKLPDATLKDIFNYTNIKKLTSAVLNDNELLVGDSTTTADDVRRLQLATLLVEIGIQTCIEQYQSKIEQDSILNELTISHLSRAREICNAISFKVRLPHLEEEAEKRDLVYLFNWNRIKEIHEIKVSELKEEGTKQFVGLLSDIYYGHTLVPPDVINTISFNQTEEDRNSNILVEFTDFYGGQCHGRISLNLEKKTAHLSMHTEDKRILQHDFVIKIENENLYVYKKRKMLSKLVSRSKRHST